MTRWPSLLASTLLICCATQAEACRAPDLERFVFLPSLPMFLPDEAVVLLVTPFNDDPVASDRIRVRIEKVVKGKLTASWIEVRFPEITDCDRFEFFNKPAYLVGTVKDGSVFNPLSFHMRDLGGVDAGQDGSFKIRQKPQ